VYNLHVNMFFLPDIDIWTRILLTLLTKCISTPWRWPLRAETCRSVRVWIKWYYRVLVH